MPPDLRGQSLGLLLTSGEQAWQTRATIAGPLALPAPGQPRSSGCWGGAARRSHPQPDALRAAGAGLKLGTVLQQQGGANKEACATVPRRQRRDNHLLLGAGGHGASACCAPQRGGRLGIQFQSAGFIGFMVAVTAVLRQPAGAVRDKVAQQSQHSPRHQRRLRGSAATSCRGVSPPCSRPPARAPSSAPRWPLHWRRRSASSGSSSPPSALA